jgi:hypothetical protein
MTFVTDKSISFSSFNMTSNVILFSRIFTRVLQLHCDTLVILPASIMGKVLSAIISYKSLFRQPVIAETAVGLKKHPLLGAAGTTETFQVKSR